MQKVPESVKEFWRRNQIILFHFPLLLLALYAGYIVLKASDPRIGVEGFGDLFGYALNAVGLSIVIFTCWWFKNNAWHDLPVRSEESLVNKILAGHWPAFWLRVLDRVEWAFLLVFFYKVIFR
jgi:hypothetical protein